MADEIVDLGKVRESKAKKFERYCQHTDSVGRRYQILRLTIKEMRKFSSKEEIAETLRFPSTFSNAETAEGLAALVRLLRVQISLRSFGFSQLFVILDRP
jgi:hypothetical protein